MYVASGDNDRILRFTASGDYVDDYVPQAAGGMDNPRSIVFGPNGNVFVAAQGTNRNLFRYGIEQELVFVVSMDVPSATSVSVDFLTVNGTATGSSDFNTAFGTLVFEPGQTRKRILVPTIDDTLVEGIETMSVTLSNASGAALADGQATGTITDNDQSLSFDRLAVSETPTFGTVSGTYLATHAADGQGQTLTEEKYSGNKRSRMTHTWRFDNVTGGAGSELVVVATHLNNTGAETFTFAYSTDNVSWTTLGNLGPASFALPAIITGTVYIRVSDSDRSLNESTLDALAVDQLMIRSNVASGPLAAALDLPTGRSPRSSAALAQSTDAASPQSPSIADRLAVETILTDLGVLRTLFDEVPDGEPTDFVAPDDLLGIQKGTGLIS